MVLCKSESKHWLIKRLGSGHVYAVRKSRAGTMWTIVDPTNTVLEATTIPVSVMPEPQEHNPLATRVIRCIIEPEMFGGFKLRLGVLSCVTVIKALLCLQKWYVLTPDQLGDYLINSGIGKEYWKINEVTQ